MCQGDTKVKIVCPSGLSGTVRKLKGSEANVLSDRKAAKKGETYDKILRACWEETTDPGVYQDLPTNPNWAKILVCDRFYALVCIRIATYGPEYIFPTQCPSDKCGETGEWQINLATDLPILDLPEESREAIREGRNRFETRIGGSTIAFKLMTGADEKKAGKRASQNKSELMTTSLASRILEIDGMTRSHEIDKWLKDADLDLQWDLLRSFEEVDGGVEQSIEIECQECFKKYLVTLPFEGEGFWIPSTRKSRSLRRTKTRTVRTIED